jgi:hypothetical protein
VILRQRRRRRGGTGVAGRDVIAVEPPHDQELSLNSLQMGRGVSRRRRARFRRRCRRYFARPPPGTQGKKEASEERAHSAFLPPLAVVISVV